MFIFMFLGVFLRFAVTAINPKLICHHGVFKNTDTHKKNLIEVFQYTGTSQYCGYHFIGQNIALRASPTARKTSSLISVRPKMTLCD